MTGTDVRTALGLRSTWFRIGVLALDPLPANVVAVRHVVHADRPRSRPRRPAARATGGRDDVVDAGPRDRAPTRRLVLRSLEGRGAGRLPRRERRLTTPVDDARRRPARRAEGRAPTLETLKGSVQAGAAGDAGADPAAERATGGWSTRRAATASSSGPVRSRRSTSRPATYRARVVAGNGWSLRCRRKSSSVDPRSGCCRRSRVARGRATPMRRASPSASIAALAAARRRAAWRARHGGSRPRAARRARRRRSTACRGLRRIDGVRWVEWLGTRPPARVHADRPARAEAVVPPAGSRLRLLAGSAAGAPAGEGRRVDSGIDATHPDLASRIAARAHASSAGSIADSEGHGTFVAGEIAAAMNNVGGDRRHRLPGATARREGRARRRHGLARGRGEGDPLGRRPGRPRDQPQPRRPARPEQPEPRHVLGARGGRDRLRGGERRRASSRPSATATRRRRRPGRTRAIRRRCRTSSA